MPYSPPPLKILDEGTQQGFATEMDFVGSGVSVAMSGTQLTRATVTISGSGGLTVTDFTTNLGVARRSGTFDITGLSGLTTDKNVFVMQTSQQISSKGNARDEPEMDQIQVSGYVLNATTIRCFWWAPSVVVGTYAFAYAVSG